MSKSLGLIEVKSFIGAAASADAILKNTDADVSKESTAPGNYLLKITGDTESVKTAVEIGIEAARRLGLYQNSNIIEDPDPGLEELFFNNEQQKIALPHAQIVQKKSAPAEPEEKIVEPPVNKVEKKTIKTIRNPKDAAKKADKKLSDMKLPESRGIKKRKEETPVKQKEEYSLPLFDSASDTILRLRQEALGIKKEKVHKEKTQPETSVAENTVDKNSKPQSEDIENMNVHELRHLARSIEGFPIKGRVISRANRDELMKYFNEMSL